jgi:DNA (cytosine-5)-methyltransferase 1
MSDREEPLEVFSLFTGIGLHDLGLEWAGMKIMGQCEIDEFCGTILERHWPGLPRWRDVRDVTRASVIERCGRLPTIVTGGFPCQQISSAGKGAGLGTKEAPTAVSGLWWEMRRIIEDVGPDWVLIENVPALKSRGADAVLGALDALGYATWPLVVGAWAVGAPHKRDRVWIVGHAKHRGVGDGAREEGRPAEQREPERSVAGLPGAHVENPDGDGRGEAGGRGPDQPTERPDWAGAAVADAGGERREGGHECDGKQEAGLQAPQRDDSRGRGEVVADAASPRCDWGEGQEQHVQRRPPLPARLGDGRYRWPARPGEPQYEWEQPRVVPATTEPKVGGATNGSPRRVAGRAARLKALGNANPPHVVAAIGRAIMRARSMLASGEPEPCVAQEEEFFLSSPTE